MGLNLKMVLAGTLVVGSLSLAGAALADGMLAPSYDPSKLVIFNDTLFSVRTEPSVSTEALSTAVIRKIEFGRTTFVTVTTTANGTYSTDGLYSPHFRYPGIHVRPLTGQGTPIKSVAFWSDQSGWVSAPLLNAGSVLVLGN